MGGLDIDFRTDLSLEFLMGRALDNAMLNVGLKDVATGNFRDRPADCTLADITRRGSG